MEGGCPEAAPNSDGWKGGVRRQLPTVMGGRGVSGGGSREAAPDSDGWREVVQPVSNQSKTMESTKKSVLETLKTTFPLIEETMLSPPSRDKCKCVYGHQMLKKKCVGRV